MEKKHIRLLIFFSFFSLISISAANGHCQPVSCGRIQIRSPFRIIDRQPSSCGSPGFDLYCNKQNQTLIRLPSSRSYTVNQINYNSHIIYIDQDFCKRNEINDLNVTGTPFVFPNLQTYTFYNCSIQNSSLVYPSVPFPCLSSRNHSVIAVRPEFFSHRRMPSRCKVINMISVSVPINGDIRSDVELMWFDPCSESCENEGESIFSTTYFYRVKCHFSPCGLDYFVSLVQKFETLRL
ncbi:putative wall-associated receptor kinase, galacturonan-binding domain-containing protein [Helianthus annuus]|nr:putative wall-associated receptor kinase, galacturonan-binding domain-containing protein [Helianthus annuus]